MEGIFPILGAQLRNWRHRRRFTQPQLAERLGRDRARISELERDLAGERWGRDRLTLFAEACDALDVVPVLVPRGQAKKIQAMIAEQGGIRSEEHTSELQSLMRISYAVFCLKKKKT